MAAGITYDGVESALSVEGGNIFQGISFWVAQRVPMRNDILSKIRNNGGTVVPLEKTAKYLIADHVRKDVPPGSFSWKFITDSVEHGALQVEDRYRIGPDPHEPRPAGGGGLTRGARVAFSHSDDAALAKWVMSKPEASRLGNKLYQEWEQLNPRHTWQSWRNRWAKTLSRLGEHELKMLAATVADTSQSQLPAAGQAEPNVPIPASTPTVSRQSPPAPEPVNAAAPPPPAAGGRAPFTREDDAIIAQWAFKNSLVLGTKTFKILAQEHPHHNWDSWRTRWNKKLRQYSVETLRALAQESAEKPQGSNSEPRPASSIDNNDPSRTEIESAKSEANQRRTTDSSKQVGSPVTDESLPAAQGSRGTLYTEQQDQNRNSKANMQQGGDPELNKTDGEEPDPTGSQAEEEGLTEMEEGMEDDLEQDLEQDDDAARDQFYRDLLNFCGCGPEDFEWPVISGPSQDHEVDLYDLAQAYDAQMASFEHIKWEEVARDLGLPPQDEIWAAEALHKCFVERLMEFLEAINDFEPGLAEDEEQEHGQELVPATMASSPPVHRGNPKRDWEADYISSAASVRKRRRLRDVEIPSTPDEEIGVSRELRGRHVISASPSIRRSGTQTSQQLPLLQRTPSKSDTREARPVRPLMAGEAMGVMRGRIEQDTSDEDTPPLAALARRSGDSRAGKATRRSLPASFSEHTGPLALDFSPSPYPHPQSSPEPEEHHEPTESVSDWLSRHLRTGYPKHILNLALHHTTMMPGPSADHVVDSLANENGVPIDLPGVWLPDEDRTVQQLMSTDLSSQASSAVELTEQKRLREEQRSLIQRHTWEGLSKRKAYLRKKMEEEGGQGAAVATRKKTALQAQVQEQRKVTREGDAREAAAAERVVFTAEEKKRREIMLKRMMEEDDEEDD